MVEALIPHTSYYILVMDSKKNEEEIDLPTGDDEGGDGDKYEVSALFFTCLFLLLSFSSTLPLLVVFCVTLFLSLVKIDEGEGMMKSV